MKTRGKILLTLGCAAVLVTTSIMGTLAWFTDTDEVTNTFTVGNVTLGDDSEAGLDEAYTNEYGVKLNEEGDIWEEGDDEYRVQQNTYKLIPGHSYIKDPTIHVKKDSEDCYLFVTVKNDIEDIEAETTIENQMIANGWKKLAGAIAGTDEVVWYYAGKGETEAKLKVVEKNTVDNTDVEVFGTFQVKSTETEESLSDYAQGITIEVKAYAIQADGMTGKTISEVWTAAYTG